jgi:protease I
MNERLEGVRVAFLVANEGVEQVELTEPMKAVEQAGGTPILAAPDGGAVQAFNHLDKGDVFQADRSIADLDPSSVDAIVLPGGVANPDQLRQHEPAVELVRRHVEAGRPLGVICHGPWTLVEAGVLRGRTITSWPSLQTDIRNAGGTWVDETVVCDGNIVSSRKPDDLPSFCEQIIELFESARKAPTT